MWLSFMVPDSCIDRSMNMPTLLPKQLLGSNSRPELAGALRFVTDLVETLLNPQRRHFELVAAISRASADLMLGFTSSVLR